MSDDIVTEEPMADEASPTEAFASSPVPAQAPLIDLLGDVRVTAAVELGAATMRLGDLGTVQPGTVIELDRMVGERADLLANGHLIAHGEVVVVDGAFALRITDIVGDGE